MSIEVTNTSGQLVSVKELTDLMEFAFTQLNLHPECELNLLFVEDAQMSELHVKWMNEPGTTDVLSFPMDLPQSSDDVVILGDIVISPTVAAAQALEAGHTTLHEISILAAHGLLHILGYDHLELADEIIMFELQESIVEKWKQNK